MNKDILALVRGVNVFLGGALLVSSVAFLLITRQFYAFFPLWLPLPPYSFYFYYAYPISITMLGCMILMLDRRYGWRAIPLAIMAAGLFDVVLSGGLVSSLMRGVPWTGLQMAMAGGGWLLAGRPRFDFNSRWFWPVMVALILTDNGLVDYHVFEACLYAFIIFGVRY